MNHLQTSPALRAQRTTNGQRLHAVVRLPSQYDWFDGKSGERLAIVVHSADVGGSFSVLESVAAPGAGSPMHYHAEDKIFRILEGTLTLSLDGVVFDAHPGTTVAIPAGAPHAWRNRQMAPSRTLVTFTPGGLEELFLQLGGRSPDEIARLAAEFGTYVTGAGIGD